MLVVPHLILKNEDKFLLTRRSSAKKIWPNHWHCVSGSIEKGESPQEAIIREAEEEIGLKIKEVKLVTTMFIVENDYFNSANKYYGVELFFLADLPYDQEPINAEPLKQDAMDWFYIDKLPSPMIPGVKFGLESYFNNLNYVEFRNG